MDPAKLETNPKPTPTIKVAERFACKEIAEMLRSDNSFPTRTLVRNVPVGWPNQSIVMKFSQQQLHGTPSLAAGLPWPVQR